jgi:hypothetical protein
VLFASIFPIHELKLEMMRFDFTMVHRPECMVFECNLLLLYITWTSELRHKDQLKSPSYLSERQPAATSLPFWRAEAEKIKIASVSLRNFNNRTFHFTMSQSDGSDGTLPIAKTTLAKMLDTI